MFNPEIIIGGTITVFPPIVTVTWAANHTVNDPLCDGDPGSIVVSPSAITVEVLLHNNNKPELK